MKVLDQVRELESQSDCLHTRQEVEAAIDEMARKMTAVLEDRNPLFLCVMNGSVIFTGHLMVRLPFPLQLDYIHASRYHGKIAGGELVWLATPRISLQDRHVVILEDVLDSGLTFTEIQNYCKKAGAAKVYTAALVDKRRPRDPGGLENADFVGLTVENRFLYGFGLDYEGYLRNAPGIFAVRN